MRTMENPIHIEAYRALGILPTPMAFTEVFTALQQGTVDGQENPLSVITVGEARPGPEVPDADRTRLLAGADPDEQGASGTKLSPADKQAFLAAAREAVKANRARIDEDEKNAVAELRAKGMQVVEHVDKATFQAALAPIFADFGRKFGQANIDRIHNYR